VTPAELSVAIVAAVQDSAGDLGLSPEVIPAEVTVERPRSREHGDWATNVAMRLAKPAGKPPREVAEAIAARLRTVPGIAGVDVAGPGFLNLTLDAAAAGAVAADILRPGDQYGTGDSLAGQRVNLEFVSANPTGPLHLGHTRWAAVGDALARVLRAAGASVDEEFYINDRGGQMDRFGESLAAFAAGDPPPEDGYHGEYMRELADQVVLENPGILDLPDAERMVAFREAGYELQLAQQRAVLDRFRTHFTVWVSERSLHDSGAVPRAFEQLREQGHVYEADGAVWLRTTDFGDDKARVLRKSDGDTTYFASDAAYYVDKRQRGFDRCVYLLGADHHGYVGRLRAIAACAGDEPETHIEVLIGQLVKIVRAGVEVRLSKRAGEIVTLEDLVDEVGVDAARYELNRYPTDSPLTLDLDVLVRQSNDNPVFYVQYAHARIASLLRNAAELGVQVDPDSYQPALLEHPTEEELLATLARFPAVVASSAELREPHRIARYLEELATAYHKFYDSCRVLPRGDEDVTDLHRSRLLLCAATRQVLANGLDLLGVTAPERM
jgi:arginyl-tRNA synthetase